MGISLDDLEWRGLLYQVTDRRAIEALPAGTSFYAGYDPTARSLQVGNLVTILTSVRLAQAGLKPIQLFGGSTGSIGDPSGKSSERTLMSREEIEANVDNHKRLVKAVFERSNVEPLFVDNYDWTKDVSVLTFLRDVGKYFTVNYMLAKDHVKTRLDGDGISYTEFTYSLLQAYDYLHLLQANNCRLQIGGSDQWGNMTAGLELIRKKTGDEAHVLSFPLITNAAGQKFGKSEGNAVWLDAAYTSPYKMHQYFLNQDDASCDRLLKVFTFKTQEEIAALEQSTVNKPGAREAQKALADALCDIMHGNEATIEAKKAAAVLFGGSLEGLSKTQLVEIFSEAPSISINAEEFSNLSILDAFVKAGLAKSKGDVRRLLEAGGAYCSNVKIENGTGLLKDLASPFGNIYVLRSGKKNFALLQISQ